jgi:hypothetical protein
MMNNNKPKRPTPEQIAEAREWFTEEQIFAMENDGLEETAKMVRVLRAATEPPTDLEIADIVREQPLPTRSVERWAYIIATNIVRKLFGPVKP